MKLICFPYAGGSSKIFDNWQSFFGKSIEVIPYELAGRGKRIAENDYTSIDEMIDEVLSNLIEVILYNPYYLFGHSMGTSIVYKLLEAIMLRKLPYPKHIFMSGSQPPHLKNSENKNHLLPKVEFIKLLQKYGKTPDAFFENEELLDFYLPKLRKDFEIANLNIDNIRDIVPFPISLTTFYGVSENNYSNLDALDWKKYTSEEFEFHTINGSHFFIDENQEELLGKINEIINN